MAPKVTLRVIPVRDLVPNPRNIRQTLHDVDELANSIRANGLQQPLIVNVEGGRLVVTDGHRRLEACKRACVPAVPCLVTEGASGSDVTTTMLAAAMHQQLRPIEQARAFQRLKDSGVTTAEISRATGYRVALINQRLLLLELPYEAQVMVEEQTLSIGEATELAREVKSSRSGGVTRRARRQQYFAAGHPLARAASTSCHHGETRVLLAGACGRCWEDAIRADERARLEAAS